MSLRIYLKILHTSENGKTARFLFLIFFPTCNEILTYPFTPWGKIYLMFRTTKNRKKRTFFFFFKEWNVSYCVVDSQARSPHTWCASWISFGVIVNTFGMDSAQVVLKKANQIGLTCFLQSTSCCTLEVQICLKPRAVSHTRLWKGSLRIRSCADFW